VLAGFFALTRSAVANSAESPKEVEIPPNVRQSLERLPSLVDGHEFHWEVKRSTDQDPAKVLDIIATRESADDFFRSERIVFRSQQGKYYESFQYKRSPLDDHRDERAVDGTRFYTGNPSPTDQGQPLNPGLIIEPLFSANRVKQALFSHWSCPVLAPALPSSGYLAPQFANESDSPFLRSAVLSLAADGRVQSYEPSAAPSHPLVAITLEAPEPWGFRGDMAEAEKAITSSGMRPESVAFQLNLLRMRGTLSFANRQYKFEVDPSLGYAVRTITESRASGEPLFRTKCGDFRRLPGSDAWFPGTCEVVAYTWETNPVFSAKDPLFKITYSLSDVKAGPFSDDNFVLNYSKPGTDVQDNTLKRANGQPGVAYKIPANRDQLAQVIEQARGTTFQQASSSSSGRWFWLITLNAALVIVLAIVWFVRARAR
jgi:hypothetical protein